MSKFTRKWFLTAVLVSAFLSASRLLVLFVCWVVWPVFAEDFQGPCSWFSTGTLSRGAIGQTDEQTDEQTDILGMSHVSCVIWGCLLEPCAWPPFSKRAQNVGRSI